MSSILPKGIIVNAPGISGKIERIDKEPLANEEIAKLWKVYTTTNRRLLDPTAERLENYWWRIWGSRKRNLKGATVARLFVEISNGTTFVPLRDPADLRSGTEQAASSGSAGTTAVERSKSEGSTSQQPPTASNSSTNLPPPILKKTRGPLPTGPRPMARFITPHSSEGEGDGSQSNMNCHVIIEPPTPDAQHPPEDAKIGTQPMLRKKAHSNIMASAGHKRRTGLSRGSASQSTSSDTTSQTAAPGKSTPGKSQPKATESHNSARLQSRSKSQENLSLSPEKKVVVRKVPKKSRSVKIEPTKKLPEQKMPTGAKIEPGLSSSSSKSKSLEPGPSSSTLQSVGKSQDGPPKRDRLEEEGLKEKEQEQQEILPTLAKSNLEKLKTPKEDAAAAYRGFDMLPKIQRSRSFGDKSAMLSTEHHFPKTIDAKSTVSLAPTTYTAATGKLNFRDKLGPTSIEGDNGSNVSKGKGKDKGKESPKSLFVKRPVQSMPTTSTLSVNLEAQAIPNNGAMSRSKSQLTLLLEKDRARTTEHKGESNTKLPNAKERGDK